MRVRNFLSDFINELTIGVITLQGFFLRYTPIFIFIFIFILGCSSVQKRASNDDLQAFLKEYESMNSTCEGISTRDCILKWQKVRDLPYLHRNLENLSPFCKPEAARLCTLIGFAYEKKGVTNKRDIYIKKACDFGFYDACGVYHFTNYERDKSYSLDVLEGYCEKGSSSSCNFLGLWYSDNNFKNKAIDSFKKSCQLHLHNGCYNLACELSESGKIESAFNYLEKALSLGFSDWDHMDEDQSLKRLRRQDKYRRLIKYYKSLYFKR